MDALGEHQSQAEIFQDSNILYLHCVDTQYPLQLKIAGLPLLSMESYFCHFSFMNSLSNRRICILPNSAELLRKIYGVNSPSIINVTSSVVFKFHQEDVAGQYDEVLLIWDFDVDVLLSTTATPLAPKYPPDNDDENSGICPLLDITKTTCNCSSFPIICKVLIDLADFTVPETQMPNNVSPDIDDEFDDQLDEVLELRLPDIHVNVIDEQDADQGQNADLQQNSDLEQDEEQGINDAEEFAELIFMKGTTFHGHFQEALHACKQLMLEGRAPEISLTAEPVNKRDENAIVVKALLTVHTPIGYIPARKLPKVTDAMRKGEITTVALNNVIYKYIHAAKGHRYFAKVLILKSNRWLPDSPTYEYNDPI